MDLLEADVGGTCMFLREECCFYTNEAGLVGTDLNHSTTDCLKNSDNATRAHLRSVLSGSLHSSRVSPVLRAGGAKLFFLLAACLLCFLQDRICEVSQVMVNHMLCSHTSCTSPLIPISPISSAGNSQIGISAPIPKKVEVFG